MFGDGFSGGGDDPVCGDFGEWLQYKNSLAHAWVRNTEFGDVKNQIIEEQDIDIDAAAAPSVMLLRTSQKNFNALSQFKELLRGAIPESCGCTVGEAGCTGMTVDWLTLLTGGHVQIRYAAGAEHRAGALKGLRGPSEIGTESKCDPFA